MNGAILVETKQRIDGSRNMFSWHEEWLESYDIVCKGKLTKDIKERIVKAFKNSKEHKSWRNTPSGSLCGALRWDGPDRGVWVTDDKKLIVKRVMCISD
tara:strand:- start:107 stop:403 length:297 start_codon:yes stop_codon:yes gene_type:complete